MVRGPMIADVPRVALLEYSLMIVAETG